MKKIILFALMAVAAISANAQDKKFHITPHLGIGYMNVSGMGDYCDYVTAKIGGEFEFMVAEQFGISAGVDYQYGVCPEKDNVKYEFGTVNIPVLAQYHFGNFAVKAGVQPTFLAEAKAKYSTSHVSASGDFKDECESFQLFVPVALTYTFNVPVTIGLECDIPCTKLSKSGYDTSRITTVMVTAGYRF